MSPAFLNRSQDHMGSAPAHIGDLLARFPVPVIKTMTKSDMGRERFI